MVQPSFQFEERAVVRVSQQIEKGYKAHLIVYCMKFLVIGDFHGKLPLSMKRIVAREEIDMILSPGDYCGNKKLSQLIFRYLYGKDESEIPKHLLKKKTIEERSR